MSTHTPFHGESQESADAAGETIDHYLSHADWAHTPQMATVLADDESYDALRFMLKEAIRTADIYLPTVASLDGTDDAADWLGEGYSLSREDVEWIRSLRLPRPINRNANEARA
jgi:hypothetical protein